MSRSSVEFDENSTRKSLMCSDHDGSFTCYQYHVRSSVETEVDVEGECNDRDRSAGDQGLDHDNSREIASKTSCFSMSRGCGEDSKNFAFTAYGEPLRTQQIILDFTPLKGIDDNPDLTNKCFRFWDMLSKYPNLKILKALPEPRYSVSEDSDIRNLEESKESILEIPLEKTAAEWAAKDWIMNSALTTDIRKPFWEPLSEDYLIYPTQSNMGERRALTTESEKPKQLKTTLVSKCRKPEKPKGYWNTQKICNEMDEWDRTHPHAQKLGAGSSFMPKYVKS